MEKEKGAMAEDEEETAEAGEVEKEKKMHQCSECGKSYKYEHKLKHHTELGSVKSGLLDKCRVSQDVS